MIEVLQFVFSSFWHWLGTLIIVAVIAEGIGSALGRLIPWSKKP